MKKMFGILLVALLLLTGCGATPEHSFTQEKAETVTLTINEEEVPCYAVYGTYNNSSAESACAADWIDVKAYQNGVALSPIVPADKQTNGYFQCDQYIQPGTSKQVVFLFTLADTSDVTVEITQ